MAQIKSWKQKSSISDNSLVLFIRIAQQKDGSGKLNIFQGWMKIRFESQRKFLVDFLHNSYF